MSLSSEKFGSVTTVHSTILRKQDVSRSKRLDSKSMIVGDNRRPLYSSMLQRHVNDVKYMGPIENLDLEDWSWKPSRLSFPEIYPSYTNFKVPYPMICKERYGNNIRKYNNQLYWEICNLIDNQPTATEATNFVRTMSYTSLWPPYHTEAEIDETSRSFYSLRPKEKARLQVIMETDF